MSSQPPLNEPVHLYAPGSAERAHLRSAVRDMQATSPHTVPLHVGGRTYDGHGERISVSTPHRHSLTLVEAATATTGDVRAAVDAALAAHDDWSTAPWETRASVFLRAADLLSGPFRDRLNAATILGQSKSVQQAEIDAACELIDFWRWNVHFGEQLQGMQPVSSAGTWNRMDHRPLEGFVLAITPFNFTSIGGNLPTAPALMGNTVLWKPGSTAGLSGYYLLKVLQAAGMPDGVINFLPGRGSQVGDPVLAHADLGGIHFTG